MDWSLHQRPPIQLEACLKFKVVLKLRDIHFENLGMLSLISGLKIEGGLKIELKGQGALNMYCGVLI